MNSISDDPAYIEAAESLLQMETQDIEVKHRSDKQQALRIPPRLIGIASMCNGDKNLFEFLLRQDHTIQQQYSYSPTLLPERQVDLERIANLVKERMIALKTAADKCAEELAAEEVANEQRVKDRLERKLRKAKLKKKKASPLCEKVDLGATNVSDTESQSDHSLSELSHILADKQQHARLSSTSTETSKTLSASRAIGDKTSFDLSWTIVSKTSVRSKPKLPAPVLDTASKAVNTDAGSSHGESPKEHPKNCSNIANSCGKIDATSKLPKATTPSNDERETISGALATRFSEIEGLHLQLSKERRETTRLQALLVEKDAMLQNLQLRLYISDTRLRTYEEALRAHVDQVQNNLATELSSNGNQKYPEDDSKLLRKGVVPRG